MLVWVLGALTLAGCGAGSKARRVPVEVLGNAIRPVSKEAPEGTLTQVASGPVPPEPMFLRATPAVVPDSSRKRLRPDTARRAAAKPPKPVASATPAVVPDSLRKRARPDTAGRAASEPPKSLPSEDYVYVEVLPEAITRVEPIYPESAKSVRVAGTVMVQALVGRDGRVLETRIVKSIPELDEAAMACVRQWRFKPAMGGGKPLEVWTSVPIRFTFR